MSDRRRLEGGLFVLAALGALLIVPPLVYLFNQPISHFGVPQIVLYLFGWWLAMIVGTALITHWLPRHDAETRDGED